MSAIENRSADAAELDGKCNDVRNRKRIDDLVEGEEESEKVRPPFTHCRHRN